MKSTKNEGSLYQSYNKVVLEFADYKKKTFRKFGKFR